MRYGLAFLAVLATADPAGAVFCTAQDVGDGVVWYACGDGSFGTAFVLDDFILYSFTPKYERLRKADPGWGWDPRPDPWQPRIGSQVGPRVGGASPYWPDNLEGFRDPLPLGSPRDWRFNPWFEWEEAE